MNIKLYIEFIVKYIGEFDSIASTIKIFGGKILIYIKYIRFYLNKIGIFVAVNLLLLSLLSLSACKAMDNDDLETIGDILKIIDVLTDDDDDDY